MNRLFVLQIPELKNNRISPELFDTFDTLGGLVKKEMKELQGNA